MKLSLHIPVMALLAATVAAAAVPRITSVEPAFGKPGDAIVANGENLGAGTVVKLFLTAKGNDIELSIDNQGNDAIKFKIPTEIELGRYNLMLQTGGEAPSLMEQPYGVTVEDDAAAKEREDRDKSLREPPPEPAPEPAPAP